MLSLFDSNNDDGSSNNNDDDRENRSTSVIDMFLPCAINCNCSISAAADSSIMIPTTLHTPRRRDLLLLVVAVATL
jgi:hypothetical protein